MKQVLRATLGAAIALLVAAGVSSAQAPAEGGPPAPTNLQVLPKDMPRDQLLRAMRTYTTGLGVQCSYCHVQEGRGGRVDMASDEKAPKKVARAMITLTKTVNDAVTAGTGKAAADVAKVECGTCHRGAAIPKWEAPAAAPPPPPRPPA